MKRLLEARKFLGLTQKQMAETLQVGQNTYSMIENSKISLTERNRSALAEKLRINPLWLDTGIGEMFLDPKINSASPYAPGRDISEERSVPYYSKPVTGSMVVSFDDLANEGPEYRVDFVPFNDCSFYRPVFGESMSPKYNSGDVIACKKVQNKRLILYGETYLCMILMDGDFYETIKILRKNDDPSFITLKPINPDFDETTIPMDSIIDLYIIKGKIERNL